MGGAAGVGAAFGVLFENADADDFSVELMLVGIGLSECCSMLVSGVSFEDAETGFLTAVSSGVS